MPSGSKRLCRASPLWPLLTGRGGWKRERVKLRTGCPDGEIDQDDWSTRQNRWERSLQKHTEGPQARTDQQTLLPSASSMFASARRVRLRPLALCSCTRSSISVDPILGDSDSIRKASPAIKCSGSGTGHEAQIASRLKGSTVITLAPLIDNYQDANI